MQYPLISEYVEAIRAAEDNFDKLSHLRPVLDEKGNPVMSSGNFAVVFKMKDNDSGRLFAIKCFTKDQKGREERYAKISAELEFASSPYLVRVRYLERELFVDAAGCDNEEFPVLMMDWVEGQPLDGYLKQHLGDSYALRMLAYRFCKMGAWLLSQPFAHGDLKPDNILVRNDGSLVLVDYDGMFVPAMEGEEANETGSPDFRHPLRTEKDFNEHIDDFSIASIALSLKAIALSPALYDQYAAADRLLFSAEDYRDIGKSQALQAVVPLASDTELSAILSAFLLAYAKNSLGMVSFRLFLFNEPEKPKVELLSTEATDEENATAITDEYGATYTKDGMKLIRVPSNVKSYSIKDGTRVICDGAFWRREFLQSIHIPDSVTSIGGGVFNGCNSLESVIIESSQYYAKDNILYSRQGRILSCWSKATSIVIPDGVTSIGEYAFYECKSLQSIHIPDSVTSIGNRAFGACGSLQSIHIPDSVTSIGDRAFEACGSLQSIHIPDSVTSIGDRAFGGCGSLQSIHIPDGVTSIGDSAFYGCKSLQSIHIPDGVTSIGDWAFSDCKSLQSIHIPDSVTSIGDNAFNYCSAIQSIHIPDGVTSIGDGAFGCCKSLQAIHIPNSVTSIGDWAFLSCESLQAIHIPNNVTSIGDGAFCHCESLKSIHIPDSVTSIGDRAFQNCKFLKSIHIPDSVTSIGKSAFSGCTALQSIQIPDSVTSIGKWAFSGCTALQSIHIPDSVTSIRLRTFVGCKSLQTIYVPDRVTSIGHEVFRGCESLHSIHIPKGRREKFLNLLGQEYEDKLVEE